MVIQSWIIAGLIDGCLAFILFVLMGAVSEADTIAAIIAFTCAAILLAVKRVVIRPWTA